MKTRLQDNTPQKRVNKNSRRFPQTDSCGFSLIELSIVLVILGLIVGTVAPLLKTLTKSSKIREGRKTVSTASDEIKGEILRTAVIPSDLSNIGHTIDPWQNDLIYVPAASLAGQHVCSWLALGTNQTGLAVCLEGDCLNEKKANVAFVVASMGSNFNRQLETAANRDGDGSDQEIRLYSYATEIDGYTTAPDPNRATDQFDEIVEYVTIAELLQYFSCSVTVRNATGDTLCYNGSAISDDTDIANIPYNTFISIGETLDNCATINSSCQISFSDAKQQDSNGDGQVKINAIPPLCTLVDL